MSLNTSPKNTLKMKMWESAGLSQVPAFKIPKIGFGTYQLKGLKAVSSVEYILKLGLRHIDTASIYNNETEVGEALKNSFVPRKNIFLTTKLWLNALDKKSAKKSMQTSLAKLQTNYVDLLLIHWPSPTIDLNETLEAMRELQKEKKLRFIGVSNFPLPLLKKAKQICPDLITNQVEYHPLLSQKTLLAYLKNRYDMFLTAYCPLMRSKVNQIQQIINIAKKHKKTPSQITLKWLVDQKNVIVIFKSENQKHILENTNIFDFELDKEDQDQLFRLNNNKQRIINPPFAPQWDN